MLLRTVCGLSLSVRLGMVTATFSALIALALGAAAASGRTADSVVSWFTDLMMGGPHILLLLLISFACGRGVTGVVVV
jgi:ABC-type dipeptide/oligopeptide/nickel transport system permease subunit